MERISITPRPGWEQKVEELGFLFHHTQEGLYWDESAYYCFTYTQIEKLETVTTSLHDMCLHAAQYIIDKKLYHKLGIPDQFIPYIEKSWNEKHPVIYGRFDLCYNGIDEPKMLEYNADTPTSLFEASIVQWFWLQDTNPALDQFNSLHEKLVAHWAQMKQYYNEGALYFTCVKDHTEDLITTEYLRDCAMQAGLETRFIYINDIGYDEDHDAFVDLDNEPIRNIFKLYPWEWMINESYGAKLLTEKCSMIWTEPPWKMLLSNKGLLPILWQLYPDHPNLLASYFEGDPSARRLNNYVKKPLLSREGANIAIYQDNNLINSSNGEYGEEGYIRQQYCPLPMYGDNYPVIGAWMIGGSAAGIGIRESKNLITDNLSRFVPHLIRD